MPMKSCPSHKVHAIMCRVCSFHYPLYHLVDVQHFLPYITRKFPVLRQEIGWELICDQELERDWESKTPNKNFADLRNSIKGFINSYRS